MGLIGFLDNQYKKRYVSEIARTHNVPVADVRRDYNFSAEKSWMFRQQVMSGEIGFEYGCAISNATSERPSVNVERIAVSLVNFFLPI